MCSIGCGRPRKKFAKECLTLVRADLTSFGGYAARFAEFGFGKKAASGAKMFDPEQTVRRSF